MLLYVLVDTSGSTVRGHVNAGVNLALPALVGAVEERYGAAGRFCLATYGTEAAVRVPLTRAVDVSLLPALPPGGVSSLAAGLATVARAVTDDREQLRADGDDPPAPVVLIIADGLPTDRADTLLAARDALGAAGVSEVDLVVPDDVDGLAVAGLRMRRHPLATGDPATVCGSALAAARHALDAAASP